MWVIYYHIGVIRIYKLFIPGPSLVLFFREWALFSRKISCFALDFLEWERTLFISSSNFSEISKMTPSNTWRAMRNGNLSCEQQQLWLSSLLSTEHMACGMKNIISFFNIFINGIFHLCVSLNICIQTYLCQR